MNTTFYYVKMWDKALLVRYGEYVSSLAQDFENRRLYSNFIDTLMTQLNQAGVFEAQLPAEVFLCLSLLEDCYLMPTNSDRRATSS